MKTKKCIKCGIEKPIDDFRISRNSCKKCEREYSRNYNESHKEKFKEYYQNHKEEKRKQHREYYKNNKDKLKEHYKKNKTKLDEYHKKYYINNKEKINEYKKKYDYNKRKNNNIYKLKTETRHLIWMSFNKKGKLKSEKTENILGCTLDFFIKHLLKSYKKKYGVEWNGLEKVHIDHIIPLATANTEKEVMKLCHYTNLQLLKAKDNLYKGCNINWELKT